VRPAQARQETLRFGRRSVAVALRSNSACRPGVTPAAIRGAGARADIPALWRWPQPHGFTRRPWATRQTS